MARTHTRLRVCWCRALQAGPVIDAGGIFEFARRSGMIKTV